MKKDKNSCNCANDRLGKVGGQAVLEGVMMKADNRTVTTCRKEDGSLTVTASDFVSVRTKHKILDLPVIRGVVNFVEMMMLSMKTLSVSADALGIEEEEPGKFEKWLRGKFGVRIVDFIMGVAMVLGVALAILLFVCLPGWLAGGVDWLLGHFFSVGLGAFRAVIEGVLKIAIFISYLLLVSLMSDIKRTFMYHGAEHKSIACFEAGDELTPENARKHTRFHPRCGTSFMFLMILIGIFAGFFIHMILPGLHWILYSLIRILILPLLMGVGYEFIRLAGKHQNILTRILSAPGIWAQRITTKEPTDDMLEVAIISLKCALRDQYPEFMEFYNERPWEPKTESTDGEEAETEGDADSEGSRATEAVSSENAEAKSDAEALVTDTDVAGKEAEINGAKISSESKSGSEDVTHENSDNVN